MFVGCHGLFRWKTNYLTKEVQPEPDVLVPSNISEHHFSLQKKCRRLFVNGFRVIYLFYTK